MSSRSSGLRIKVVALLLSLVALWAFAATVTLREGLNLLSVSALSENLGEPTESLLSALQEERRLSLVYLGGGRSDQRAALATQREQTDEVREEFQRLARGGVVKSAADEVLEQRIDGVIAELGSLNRSRVAIDARSLDRRTAVVTFTDIIDAGFRVYGSLSTLDDEQIAKESRTLIALSRAREVLSQEDAMLAGVLASGRLSATEHEDFTKLVGAQRFLYAEAEAELPADDRERFRELITSTAFLRFRGLEDRVIATGDAGTAAPVTVNDWNTATTPVFTELRQLELSAAEGTIERAKPAAIWVLVRLLLAGGLGLMAVIASIVVSITTARSLVRQLEKLRNAARELANQRLPRVVDRLRRGEEVDVAREAPPLSFGTDEIGQVGRAFNDVQETAVRVAVEQAELRQGVRDVFLSLARRSQALVHRQLSLLDAMERKETVPDELEQLFRVDHLATRMRRNAENLIVLSGAVPGRGWRNPIPIVDVVRGAVGEVEEYERVTVAPVGQSALAGRAVGDIIHLLAELIENALSFSPPHTMVQVSGQLVGNGFAVEVEDRGLGMSAQDLEAANEQLENPPEFNLTSTARLGLYVVGRLAERHKVKVRLRTSAYGGVTAVVLIPTSLIVGQLGTPAGRPDAPRDRRASVLAGEAERSEVEETIAIDRSQIAGPGRDRTGQRDRTAQRALTAIPAEPAAPPAPAENALPCGAGRSGEVKSRTSSGLPRRVRQASLAAPLRQGPPADVESGVAEAAPRPPEDVRRMMASYQRGTAQARTEAGVPVADEVGAAAPDEHSESEDRGQPLAPSEASAETGTGQLPGDR